MKGILLKQVEQRIVGTGHSMYRDCLESKLLSITTGLEDQRCFKASIFAIDVETIRHKISIVVSDMPQNRLSPNVG